MHERQPVGGRATDVDDYPPKISPYTTRAPDGIKRDSAKLGPAVGEFAQRLFAGDHPWSRIRQGHKLIRLGERYTPRSASMPRASAPWPWTSSTCAVWNASWCRLWKRKPRPNCHCPWRPDALPVPAPSSPWPPEHTHDPRNRTHATAQTAPVGPHGRHPARTHRPGPQRATRLRLLPRDHPQRRGQSPRPPPHRTPAQ